MKTKFKIAQQRRGRLLLGAALLLSFPVLASGHSAPDAEMEAPWGQPSLASQSGISDVLLLDQTQDVAVSGTVVDQDGEPIPGVTISIPGTTIGTATDLDGKYALSVPEGATLVFSFIGYISQRIEVGGRSVIDITLNEDVAALEEVVIVGYGTQKKVNLTGAITAVKVDELNNISTNNLSNTLAGRAPGANITGTSGLAGASSSIRSRGGFGEPLFVIAGIVRDKEAFDALEANEVDQLSFWKDAATESIYGSRAGNGVVLVTTKQGMVQKPTFT